MLTINRLVAFSVCILAISAVQAQPDCLSIQGSDKYFSASAVGPTEAEARANAMSLLIDHISVVVLSRTDMVTRDVNGRSEQEFYNLSKSVSHLHLNGIAYTSCEKMSRGGGYKVVAYIGKEDLERSKEEVARKVIQYLDLANQKRAIGIDYLSETYTAYLYTFMTPYALPYESGAQKIGNVQSYLESVLREKLAITGIKCTAVRENANFSNEQLTLMLDVIGHLDAQMKLVFECPEYNARTEIPGPAGSLDVIMQPASPSEKFKGRLILRPALVPGELKDLNDNIVVAKDVQLDVDMSGIIKIDFSIVEETDYYILIPKVRHLGIRKFEWTTSGTLLSTSQQPRVFKRDVGQTITLMLNGTEALTVRKTIEGNLLPGTPDGEPPAIGFTIPDDFPQLQAILSDLRNKGKALIGKKSDFHRPSSCWVFLVEAESKKLVHALAPESNGRTDVKSKRRYEDFENQLKGFVSIWVEFY